MSAQVKIEITLIVSENYKIIWGDVEIFNNRHSNKIIDFTMVKNVLTKFKTFEIVENN